MIASVSALVFLVAIAGVYAYFDVSYLQGTPSQPVLTQYPLASVVGSMRAGGPYYTASSLKDPTSNSSTTSTTISSTPLTPTPTPATYSTSDIGKTDLSKFN